MGEIMRQYPLVNEQKAVENGNVAHLVRWFTYESISDFPVRYVSYQWVFLIDGGDKSNNKEMEVS